MADDKQDVSAESKPVVRVKRELKIAPLNPSPVKKTLDEASTLSEQIPVDKESTDEDQQDVSAAAFKPDFVDNGQYNIKIKKAAQRSVDKSKDSKSSVLLVILVLIFVILLGFSVLLVSGDAGSSVLGPITSLFDKT